VDERLAVPSSVSDIDMVEHQPIDPGTKQAGTRCSRAWARCATGRPMRRSTTSTVTVTPGSSR
jgi:hypothetical protein